MQPREEHNPIDERPKGSGDLTQESSSRAEGGQATLEARMAENDDANGGSNIGPVDSPEGDQWAENKVAVSDDD